jgi:hypothetical protein
VPYLFLTGLSSLFGVWSDRADVRGVATPADMSWPDYDVAQPSTGPLSDSFDDLAQLYFAGDE